MFGTAQDRLIKGMRLARIATLGEANRYLEEQWIPFWNERFTVAPADPLDAHRPLPPDTDLEALFAETNLRTVAHNFTVRFKNRFWQVTAPDAGCSAPSSPGSLGPHARHPTPALRTTKNPLSTPPKRTFLLWPTTGHFCFGLTL